MRAICVVLFSTLFTAGAALAQAKVSPTALFAGADIVFDGRLEKIASSPSGSVASFFVNRVIKGGAARATALRAQITADSRCHRLEENHRYLIYGRKIGDEIWVDPCARFQTVLAVRTRSSLHPYDGFIGLGAVQPESTRTACQKHADRRYSQGCRYRGLDGNFYNLVPTVVWPRANN